MRSVYDLLASRLGVGDIDVGINRDASDIDIADKIIARNDPARVALVIINLGTVSVFVTPQIPATTTRGIVLGASGGSVSMNWQDDLVLPALEWHGASNGTDNQSILVVEVRMV